MKASLTFDLPSDQYEYNCAVNSVKYRVCLEMLSEALRNEMKFNAQPNSPEHYVELFWEIVNENGIRLHND